MKMSSPIFLLIVGCVGASTASTADDSASAVRAQRAESNAAIEAHDASRLRKLFDDDYHGIQGTSGDLDSGGEATARSYVKAGWNHAKNGCVPRNVDSLRRHVAPEIRIICDIGVYR